jgi:hypothetical protein
MPPPILAGLILRTAVAALISYSTHYSITRVYTYFCIPDGFNGFLQGLVTTASPICATLLSVMSHSHITYSTLIVTSLAKILVDSITGVGKIPVPMADTGGTG